MPLNTPETTASADRVPKTGIETFGGSRRAHGTGLSTTPMRAGPGGDALRTVLDIFAERSVVPAPGQARRPPRPRGPWQGGSVDLVTSLRQAGAARGDLVGLVVSPALGLGVATAERAWTG